MFKSWVDFRRFRQRVVWQRRYIFDPDTEDFLREVSRTAKERVVTIQQKTHLWRAQLGHDWRKETISDGDVIEVPCPYGAARMKPLTDTAVEGRINPKGIPCLYAATRKATAIAEVRASLAARVSVARLWALKTLSIVDCTIHGLTEPTIYFDEPLPEERAQAIWAEIDRSFSEPVDRVDDRADYVPTQIIAEVFKRDGYDGVMYRSALEKDGYNLAIFDPDAVEILTCQVHEITGVRIESKEDGEEYHFNSKK